MTDQPIDPRPTNCRFRLQEEGKPYGRSGCSGCGGNIISGLRTCPKLPSDPKLTAAAGAIPPGQSYTAVVGGPQVLDLDKIAFETLCQAAGESNWIPKEHYFMNDWIADAAEFLRTGRGAVDGPEVEENHLLRGALIRFLGAVKALGENPPGRKDTYFEAPLLETDEGVFLWEELDAAGKHARSLLDSTAR